MANPHPVQNDALKQKWYKPLHPYRMAKSPATIKLPAEPVDVHSLVKSLPADTVREIIIIGLHQRGLLTDEQLAVLGFSVED